MDGYSLWLLPRSSQAAVLAPARDRLARASGHPPFVAHVTVVGDLVQPAGALGALARRLARSTPPLTWGTPVGGQSEFYFRSLFWKWDDAPGFTALADAVEADLGPCPGRSPFAHLSLVYGRPADGDFDPADLAALAPRALTFDRLAVVLSAKAVPLDRWKVVEEVELGLQG